MLFLPDTIQASSRSDVPTQGTDAGDDEALDQVVDFFERLPGLEARVGSLIRRSFDEVIDTARTGRWDLEQLEKTEKTYIGTKVELLLRKEFELQRGAHLDNKIMGHEVDTKFSLSGGWMIPSEAVDELCLLISGNDTAARFSVGLIRATTARLTSGTNRDGKHSISAKGKRQIRWLIQDGPLPRDFLGSLNPEIRQRVMSQPHAKSRVRTLFTLVKNELIPRSAIVGVCQTEDALKRARECKGPMREHGILVLCATYLDDRREMVRRGFPSPSKNDWLSVDL